MLGSVDLATEAELRAACGAEPSLACRLALEWTGSARAAELADVVLGVPLRIGLIFLIAWVAQRAVRRAIGRFVQSLSERMPAARADSSTAPLRAAARAQTVGLVLRGFASAGIWAIASVTALGELGINLGPLLASAGIAGVALGFGAQTLVRDFLSGTFMLIEDQYGVGDIVDLGEASGVVEAVTLRSTRLRDVRGTVWHVPNGQVVRVGNMSQQWSRALLDVAVGYDSDLDLAQEVMKAEADGLWRDPAWRAKLLEEPEVWGVERFSPEGIEIRLVLKTLPAEQFGVLRELRRRIKHAFDQAGIEIPSLHRAPPPGRAAPGARAPTGAPGAGIEP